MLFAGQDVAAVAATRPEIARAALDAIVVQYEVHDHVTKVEQAKDPGAPQVHKKAVKERRTEGDEPGTDSAGKVSGNVRPLPDSKTGDAKKALSRAAVTHEATYTTPVILHSALESHGIVVRWDDAKSMTVWASTQSIFSARDEMSEIFKVKPADVHVVTEFMGGGFGAKFGAGAPGSRLGFIAGTLAKDAGAPVKLMCKRYGEQVATGNRPDSIQEVRLGANKAGRLTAIHVRSHGTAGIGTGAGVGRNASSIYTKCPNRLVESADVFTNAGPGTAMRAPGHPQGAFAIELAIDELANKLGKDPLDIRLAHDEHPVRLEQYRLGAEAIDWKANRKAAKAAREANKRVRRGYGVAASIWGDFGRAKAAVATVNVYKDGTVEVQNGVQDLGTGIATVLAQIGAEVFGRPVESIKLSYGKSEFGRSVGSGGSQTTASVTPAVRKAAEQVKAELAELAAKKLGVKASEIRWDEQGAAQAGDQKLAFEQICRLMDDEPLTATASRPATYGAHPMKFMGSLRYQMAGVQFAEVEVDTWTGEVRVLKMVAIHDPGRVMNELTLRSQINGGIIMGTGMALCEQRVIDRRTGRVLNPNLEAYKLAGVSDIPEIDIILTEVHTGANNTGAIGIGEPATIPTAAAIANAVYDAVGEPVRSLPLTPDRVLDALERFEKKGGAA
jgi:xanthine dehydrogenase YagR molybdenum-binding subunit